MDTDKTWDAVVVGAGPAGSAFSKELAKNGFEVLMIDRRNEIGLPIRCGEGVSQNIWDDMIDIKPNSDWAYKIKGAQLVAPSGKSYKYNYAEGYVVERRVFDKLLALDAVDCGAHLLTGTTAISLEKNSIQAKHLKKSLNLKAKLIIGADGVESYVARLSGISKNIPLKELASCFQYEIKGIDLIQPNHLELYFGSATPRGYLWVFPKEDNRANIGVGVASDSNQNPKVLLDAFIKKRKDLNSGSITQVSSGNIPICKPLKKFVKDNIMIIGTAARQVNPMHGGGIGEAMEGAFIAASVAIDALEKDNFSEKVLSKYQQQWHQKFGMHQTTLYKLRKMIDEFNDEDFNYYMENIKPELIDKIHDPKGIAEIFKFILKRPKFGALFKGLLS
jgi:digeranylgeranylglycerophospholipid reductase